MTRADKGRVRLVVRRVLLALLPSTTMTLCDECGRPACWFYEGRSSFIALCARHGRTYQGHDGWVKRERNGP